MAVSITELKKQLMSKIDVNNLVEVEKVERYIDLVKSFRKVNKTITKEGESVVTQNGSQVFTKAHPLISERNKINASIITIERSFNFINKTGNQGEGNTQEHNKSDLV